MMATNAALIPPDVWQRFRDFLEGGKTGQLILHVSNGHVRAADLHESYRAQSQGDRAAS